MNRTVLKKIVSILMESPIYGALPRHEKRSVIRGLTEHYLFSGNSQDEEAIGYESSMAEIMHTSGGETGQKM